MHILNVPSFFGMKITGAPYSDVDSVSHPFFKAASICLCSSSSSFQLIRYGFLNGALLLGSVMIWYFSRDSGGSPVGRAKTSWYSSSILVARPSAPSFSVSISASSVWSLVLVVVSSTRESGSASREGRAELCCSLFVVGTCSCVLEHRYQLTEN